MFPTMRTLAFLLLLAGRAWCAEVPPVGPAIDVREAAAADALAALRAQVDGSNFRDAGFESPGEVARARLGPELPVYWGVRAQWARYRPEDGPDTVLTRLGRSLRLVTVDGKARCVIELEYRDGRWDRQFFGSGGLARRIAAAQGAASRVAPASTGSDFLVDIVAMRFRLLGRRQGARTTLTALADGYGLSAGETRPADEIILRLGAIAKQELESGR